MPEELLMQISFFVYAGFALTYLLFIEGLQSSQNIFCCSIPLEESF